MLDREQVLVTWLLEEINSRFAKRNLARSGTETDKSRAAKVIQEATKNFAGDLLLRTLKAFVDYTWPSNGKFGPVRQMLWLWKEFRENDLLPILDDLKNADMLFAEQVFDEVSDTCNKVYRSCSDFYRLLCLPRKGKACKYPVWSVRAHIQCQNEKIAKWWEEAAKIGNLVSDKAFARFDVWVESKYSIQTGANSPLTDIVGFERKKVADGGKSMWDLRKKGEQAIEGINVPYGSGSWETRLEKISSVEGLDRLKEG